LLNPGNDILVGENGGSGLLDVAGTVQVSGGNVDMFIGDGNGGTGVVRVRDGGVLDSRKTLNLAQGTLEMAPTAAFGAGQGLKDALIIGAGALFHF